MPIKLCRVRVRQFYIYLMGGETSTPEDHDHPHPPQQQYPQQQHPQIDLPLPSPEQEQDFFLLEPIANMQLTHPRTLTHYLIAPNTAALPEHTLPALRQAFPRVELFSDVRTLKQELTFVAPDELVKVIVADGLAEAEIEYLQRERKVYQIVLVGGDPPIPLRKIKPVPLWQQLLPVLQELLTRDSLQIPSSTILLADEDTKLLNKYRLNFHCATRFVCRRQAKVDFLVLARHLFPQNAAEISQFEQQYDLSLEGEARARMALGWAFRQGFFWKMVDQVTRNTTDPKRIAYVRLALKDLHEAVTLQWKRNPPHKKEIFIVVDITEQEKEKLAKSDGKFLLFTSFVKGYTAASEKEANAQKKLRPHSFIFTVMPNLRPIEPALDFGFALAPTSLNPPGRPNILLNIYNVFQVRAMAANNRNGQLQLSALGANFKQRQLNRKMMSPGELSLVRNYDYLEDMMGKIDGQATLLQLAGYLKDSLRLYDRRADSLRRSAGGRLQEEAVARCSILKGDALRRSGEFEAAENEYLTVKEERMRLVSLVHLAELYLHRGEEGKFDRTVEELAMSVQGLRGDQQQFFKARNLLAIRMIKQGQCKQAVEKLRVLVGEITNIASHSFQGRPIIHDTYRCLATCLAKCGDPTTAIDLLKDTLHWQLSCEGKTPNVALTETLIQSVTRSTHSHHEELERSLERAREMQVEGEGEGSEAELAYGKELLRSLNKEPSESSPLRKANTNGNGVNLNQSEVRVELQETLMKARTS